MGREQKETIESTSHMEWCLDELGNQCYRLTPFFFFIFDIFSNTIILLWSDDVESIDLAFLASVFLAIITE